MLFSRVLPKLFFSAVAVAAISLVGCGGWEKLPSYEAYHQGLLRPNGALRLDGFYVSGLSGHTPFYVNDVAVQPRIQVMCFYADGAWFGTGFECYDHIDSVVPKVERFLDSDWGHRQSEESGLVWGVYSSNNDTIHVEDFFPINGEYRAVRRDYALLNDTALIFVSMVNAHRQGMWVKSKVMRADAPTLFQFIPTLWKPDSTLFLRGNASFLQSQGVEP